MNAFSLDVPALHAARGRAERRARSGLGADLLARLRAGDTLDDESLAALLLAADVSTEELLAAAAAGRADEPRIATFSPVYLSNECDAECAMCGMRRFNEDLERETAEPATVVEQLEILYRRGLRGVALLTGEYRHGATRRAMLARTAAALRCALDRGFAHVLINVGSLEPDEYAPLLDGASRTATGGVAPQVTMCTFQETYDPACYARFMGENADNPRSDFARRLGNFDRAAEAGMWSVNPGILLGLNRDVAYELLALLAHVRHLLARGLTVYVSLPRLRKASGAAHPARTTDDDLARVAALISAGVPDARVVISTREPPEVQRRLLPVIDVLTPGSPGVAPYTATGARFELEASQFEVLDHRPIEAILGDCLAAGFAIDDYEPAVQP